MSQPLTDAINALTTYANEVTGKSDETLSDAVESLVDGYGGGGDSVWNKILDGTVTEIVDSDGIVKSIRGSAFQYCPDLTSVDFPTVTSIGGNAFYCCYNLTSVNFPTVTSIGNSAFKSCSNLTSANFPAVTSIGTSAFNHCSKLTLVDFPAATSIGSSVFGSCSKLTTLILKKSDSICTLSNTNAFDNTLIKSGTGYIYVPRALVDSYKAATNWSTYAAQFRALEDYTVDGTITGALDSNKI